MKRFNLWSTIIFLAVAAIPLVSFAENAEEACPNEAMSITSTPPVRVGISNTSFSTYTHSTINLSSAGGISLRDKLTGTEIYKVPSNAILNIALENKKFKVKFMSQDGKSKEENIFIEDNIKTLSVIPQDGYTKTPDIKRLGNPAVYRGVLEITKNEKNPDTFYIVNVLGLENYLRGVVPNEMPVSFGAEALKAQAIAARNYVLKPRIKYYDAYDICDSVSCQVYFGAGTENPISDMAISQTEGNVATYDGELILAQYSSTAGGYTENYENAFSSQKDKCIGCENNAIPYLKGVPDIATTPKLDNEENARDFYMNKPESFDSNSPYFRWQYEWTREELEKVLASNINNRSFTGVVKKNNLEEEEFGTLQNIEVLSRGVSGKVISLKITTDKNEYIVQKELVIRQLFKKDGKNLPSANIVFEFIKTDDNTSKKVEGNDEKNEETKDNFVISTIKVYGGGLGHGVGMSQFGAGKMHKLGYKYDEILQHYYTGVSITTPQITLSDKKSNLNAIQSFYADEAKGILYVKNDSTPATLLVNLNGNAFEISFDRHSKLMIKTDISPYMNVGKNNVSYALVGDNNKNKKAKVYIELKGAVNE